MKNLKKIIILLIILILCFGVGAYAAYTFTAGEIKYTKSDGTVVSVESALNELYSVKKDYSAGDTVTFGGEKFYVLEDSYATETKVEIIARSCLNNTDYKTQVADLATDNSYRCKFSTGDGIGEGNCNTNDSVRKDTASAVYRANNYAKLKGALNGRLLTYEEANALKTKADSLGTSSNVYKMLWGEGLYYWLGTSDYESSDDCTGVYCVIGGRELIYLEGLVWGSEAGGIRPVLTVYKSQLNL